MATEVRIKIRWRDMDAYGHVNNAVYLNYLEECRDRAIESLMGTQGSWDFVLAHVGIDFKNELTQDDEEITVRCAIAGFGRSSVRTHESIVKADGTISAHAEAVVVPRDRARDGSRPLTDAERATLRAAIEAPFDS